MHSPAEAPPAAALSTSRRLTLSDHGNQHPESARRCALTAIGGKAAAVVVTH
jgi:hypothetical protein